MKNIKAITILGLGSLLVVTIILAITSSTAGSKLAKLEEKARDLKDQNQEINDQIVGRSSLTKINEEAIKMGMVKPESFVYVSSSGIALR